MIGEIVLPAPRRIRPVPSNIFSDLRHLIGAQRLDLHPTYYDGNITNKFLKDKLGRRNGKIAFEVIESLLVLAVEITGTVVGVDLDFRDVKPAQAQRHTGFWHRDGARNLVIVSDDKIPTQFLTGNIPEGYPLPDRIIKAIGNDSYLNGEDNTAVERLVADGILLTEDTDPFVVYSFTDQHLHRGLANVTDTTVSRGFIRFS